MGSWLPATEVAIRRTDARGVIHWPAAGTNDFYLQFTTQLAPAVWSPAEDGVNTGEGLAVTNDLSGPQRFYRLQAWEVLFNGSSTQAFRGYQQSTFPGTNIWRVTTNGELETVVGGTQLDLVTTNQYADFELRWEWKCAARGNSGVNYRATELYSRAEWSGPEYQLLDDTGYSVASQNTLGAFWNVIAPTNKVLLPVGQWNQCRIIVQSNHVEHWLNGRRVVAYELNSPALSALISANSNFNPYPQFAKARSGYIAFRHENTQTWFRNIKVRRLPPV